MASRATVTPPAVQSGAVAATGESSGSSTGAIAVNDPPVGGKPSSPPTARPRCAYADPDPAHPSRPTSGRWIDVDVTNYEVRLMDGTQVVQSVGPVAVGAQINTGAYESTQTGLFHVYIKTAGLQFDPPYNTYINNWVGFDPDKANGFHSFLEDAKGNVVDASTGKVSNGCIRTGQSQAIFDFADVGMPVYVHL